MCLKSLAGSISVHGNLEDDKNLYRELLPVRLAATPFQKITGFGITEAIQLRRRIGYRIIDLALDETCRFRQLRMCQVRFD